MRSCLRDLQFGLKLLVREKGFTLTALLTVALCVGANSAIFTVLQSVLLRPLPYPEPERLVLMYNCYPGVSVQKGANSTPDYFDRRELKDVFEEVALIGFSGYDVGAEGSPERISGLYVTPSMFRMLRIAPQLGRVFHEDEAVLGNEKFVVLSHELWQRLYNADRAVLGRELRLSGVPHKILGVMPPGFQFLSREAKLWVPFAFTKEQRSDDARHSNSWAMAARLKPGVSIALAQQRIDALNKQIIERFPKYRKLLEDSRFHTKVAGMREEMVEDVRAVLYLLQAVAGFVLLIGCVNVANLMLVRSNVRMKELAIRFSLGASRWRLSRQLLTESMVIAIAGGALGVLLGMWGVRLLGYLGAERLPRGDTIHMDVWVLTFTLGAALFTGLLFGLAPVAHLWRRDLNAVFRQSERTGTAERRALAMRAAMVVCQVALAFVLLIGAGLMTITFLRLLQVDPGFKPEGVLTASISLPDSRYKDSGPRRRLFEQFLERARAIPGVREAAITTYLPFGGDRNSSIITIVGYTRAPGENPPVPGFNTIGGEYFRAMGIPLLEGRTFTESDHQDAPQVALIDEFLARKYWPRGGAVGGQFYRGLGDEPGDQPFTIIGVAGSVKTSELSGQNPRGQVYFHYKQRPPRGARVVVKTPGSEAGAVSALRGELLRIDPELPLHDPRTLEEWISRSLTNQRAAMVLCLIFAALALLLSAIGIYGVLAYTVTQRTREFGIRLALGAEIRDVLGMVFAQGFRLAAIGLVLGAAAAAALTRLMASLLFGVKPGDPLVYLGVAAVLGGAAALAALIPSLRATRIQPAAALRYE